MRSIAYAMLVACAVASAAPASAAESAAAPDSVTLRGGAFYRGRFTEVVPGNHVTIAVEGGTSKRIAWGELESAARDGKPLELGAANAKPHREPGSMVFVQLDADESAVLEQEAPAGTKNAFQWVEVCRAPCNLMMPNDRAYRIYGDGVRKSGTFALAGRNGERVTVAVDAAHTGGFVGGVVLMGVGIPTVGVGGLVALVGVAAEKSSIATGGLIATGIGAAATLAGIVLVATNSSTSIRQTTLPPPRRRESDAPPAPAPAAAPQGFFTTPEREREQALTPLPMTLPVAAFAF